MFNGGQLRCAAVEIIYPVRFQRGGKGNGLRALKPGPTKQLEHSVSFLKMLRFLGGPATVCLVLASTHVAFATDSDANCITIFPAAHHNSHDKHYQVTQVMFYRESNTTGHNGSSKHLCLTGIYFYNFHNHVLLRYGHDLDKILLVHYIFQKVPHKIHHMTSTTDTAQSHASLTANLN